jgi:hypothetical protein
MRWAGFRSSFTLRHILSVKEKLCCSPCQRSKASELGAGSNSVRLFKYCLGLMTDHLAVQLHVRHPPVVAYMSRGRRLI